MEVGEELSGPDLLSEKKLRRQQADTRNNVNCTGLAVLETERVVQSRVGTGGRRNHVIIRQRPVL